MIYIVEARDKSGNVIRKEHIGLSMRDVARIAEAELISQPDWYINDIWEKGSPERGLFGSRPQHITVERLAGINSGEEIWQMVPIPAAAQESREAAEALVSEMRAKRPTETYRIRELQHSEPFNSAGN